jgi:hypothetical protein
MAVIRIPEDIWSKVHAHLMSRAGEHFAFMCAEYSATQDGPIFLVKDVYCVWIKTFGRIGTATP